MSNEFDFAKDLPPCPHCAQGYGHVKRAGQIKWDMHTIPCEDGRQFQECTTPFAARKRWEGGRGVDFARPLYTSASPCQACGQPCGLTVVTCCGQAWGGDHACYFDHVAQRHGGRHRLPI